MFLLLAACSQPADVKTPPKPETAKVEAPKEDPLLTAAKAVFSPLPANAAKPGEALSPELVSLGRTLYFENRLSKNQDVSCNTCHMLDKYGVDNLPTSTGHKKQHGGRNAPTVYNAALHFVQFWDGRAADVEAQAKGPVTNPVEMAMPDEKTVTATLQSIPGYAPLFTAAFPGEPDAVNFDNAAVAIAGFERTLITPSRFDQWLTGKDSAINAEEKAGLKLFMDTGCTTCHTGATVGGTMYQKIGLIVPYDTKDEGRAKISGNEAEKFFFKVPSLRNIDKTAPYFHDGTVATLDEAIVLMGKHQVGKELKPEEIASIKAFLGSLTADLPADAGKAPELPAAGPKTPKPNPN